MRYEAMSSKQARVSNPLQSWMSGGSPRDGRSKRGVPWGRSRALHRGPRRWFASIRGFKGGAEALNASLEEAQTSRRPGPLVGER